ncbi:hypothetical protein KAU19_08335, partial [Candidatus Parcubacteria bacterium]|nr:hypothetical protein [Candidatus Parcubacteria bacterium]
FDPTHPYMGLAARELGILFSVFGIAALIAAIDPLRHKWLVFIVVLSSVLSDLNRASAVGCERLWMVTAISTILWLLIVIFYPYKESSDAV